MSVLNKKFRVLLLLRVFLVTNFRVGNYTGGEVV